MSAALGELRIELARELQPQLARAWLERVADAEAEPLRALEREIHLVDGALAERQRALEPALVIDPGDLPALGLALRWALEHIDEVRLEARARVAAFAAPEASRDKTYARERWFAREEDGWEPRQQRNPAQLVDTYSTCLEGTSSAIGAPIDQEDADPSKPRRKFPLSRNMTPEEAVSVTAKVFGYRTDSACRRALDRALKAIRTERTGWRLEFPEDFDLPLPNDWDK